MMFDLIVLVIAALAVKLGWEIRLDMKLRRKFDASVVPALKIVGNRAAFTRLLNRLKLVQVERQPIGTLARMLQGLGGKRKKNRNFRELKHVPQFHAAEPTPSGAAVHVHGVVGQSLRTWEREADKLKSALKASQLHITEPEPMRMCINLITKDPLARKIILREPWLSTASSLPLGVDEHGARLSLSVDNNSAAVVGGVPGSGKTTFINQALSGWASLPEVQYVLVNGKGSADFDGFGPRCWMYSKEDRDLLEVYKIFDRVHELMRFRNANAKRLFGSANFWHKPPTKQNPVIVFVVDECQTYFDQKAILRKEYREVGQEITSMAEQIVKKGRSAGVFILLATQKPTEKSIPTSIRDNAALKICFNVKTRAAAVSVLGEAIHENMETSSPLGLDRGVGIAEIDGDFKRFRSPYVKERVVNRHIQQYSNLRSDVDTELKARLKAEKAAR